MKTKWKINHNTDSIDIDQKCIGLSPRRESIPSDVAEHIHSNRGLHIQIRHNEDAQTFAQANDLAKLIHAAPYMLEALELLADEIILQGENGDQQNLSMIMHILLVARGEL